VRLRRVAEFAPEVVIRSQDAWREHYYLGTLGVVDEASLGDLKRADGFALGTPTRYALAAAQARHFVRLSKRIRVAFPHCRSSASDGVAFAMNGDGRGR
jgi:hypothetical protein